jgi:hypothetical protein
MSVTKVVAKIKTHILCSKTLFSPKIVPFMRLCKKNNCRDDNMAHARPHWIPKATNTYLECVILDDMIYLLTAIGLTPGGSSTAHIYTQTIHRKHSETEYTEQNITRRIHGHNNKNA